jgi:hypothetical protein
MNREKYDPEKPVCDNQDDFSKAFHKALKYTKDQDMKMGKWQAIILVVWLLFFIWAIVLSLKVPPGTDRIEHVLLAMIFSPAYVVSYYLSEMYSGKSESQLSGSLGYSRMGCGRLPGML